MCKVCATLTQQRRNFDHRYKNEHQHQHQHALYAMTNIKADLCPFLPFESSSRMCEALALAPEAGTSALRKCKTGRAVRHKCCLKWQL